MMIPFSKSREGEKPKITQTTQTLGVDHTVTLSTTLGTVEHLLMKVSGLQSPPKLLEYTEFERINSIPRICSGKHACVSPRKY